jgi:hypothetical protein
LLGGTGLYVLEGFPAAFVRGLHAPDGTYVVAETEEGLDITSFNQRRNRRNHLLKILQQQLRLSLKTSKVPNTAWFGLTRDEDFESVLRRARLMEWSEEELTAFLQDSDLGEHLLELLKTSKNEDLVKILNMIDRLGPELVHFRLTQLLGQLIHLRALRTMGYEDQRSQKEMGLSDEREISPRMKELQKTADMMTAEDLQKMVERTINLDELLMRNRPLGLSLLLLNAPIRLRR